MYKCINGWTKEKMIKHMQKEFKGRSTGPYIDAKGEQRHSCVYRGPEGKKCGVGLFIPDELYNRAMEGLTALKIIQEYSELELVMPLDVAGMNRLQSIHDTSTHLDEQTLANMLDFIKHNVMEE